MIHLKPLGYLVHDNIISFGNQAIHGHNYTNSITFHCKHYNNGEAFVAYEIPSGFSRLKGSAAISGSGHKSPMYYKVSKLTNFKFLLTISDPT